MGKYRHAAATLFTAVLFLAPLTVIAAPTAQTVGAVGAGAGVGLLLYQGLNNSANNACIGCQNTNASQPNYCPNISCATKSSGLTISGKCGAPGECKATSAQGLDGVMMALGLALQTVGLISALKAQSAAHMPPPTTAVPAYSGCASYYSVREPSGDPCAIYNPTPVSDTIAATPFSDFSSDIQTPTSAPATPVSDILLNLMKSGGPDAESSGGASASTSASAASTSNASLKNLAGLMPDPPGEEKKGTTAPGNLSGLVRIGSFGTTFVASLRNGFTHVAGFFGANSASDTFRAQTFTGKLCEKRPWASGAFAQLVPPSFFDTICMKIGLQVGEVTQSATPAQEPLVMGEPRPEQPQMVTVPTRPVKADIWAEPPSVRLGTRGKIFWTSEGADSCAVSGPSFEQNSLQGGGTTVPITGPTTFMIICTAHGKTFSDSVTVHLAI